MTTVRSELHTTDVRLPASRPALPLDQREAALLTERIRAATRRVCLLLLKAHEGRAWIALGYSSWNQYVRSEFSISRSRSYELLDQARVVLRLRDAAGTQTVPEVSAYLALHIKPRLGQIAQDIQERVEQAADQDAGPDAAAIMASVLDEERRVIARRRPAVRARRELARVIAEDNLSHLSDAIELLSSMPEPQQVVELMHQVDFSQRHNLAPALHWLNEFVAEWNRSPAEPLRRD
ncbi:MAG: hypothetical protein E6J41_19985 [Chloroflexi bacterium]|nr:MAG: hypothetical protein E6J41_19985 [Chloroflexota bacterium]